ncbi:MAG: molybdopterin-dependent oxidoreductase [Chloroflexi bacterium]|nr:molybdopterin-dependent oxidoreductase [Chloroflexota bacterium]
MMPDRNERWIPSTCKLCLHGCGILVKVVDGVAVKIEGNPNNLDNLGKLCPKGNAGLMRLYDPRRVKAPLRRTNPRKGYDQDPGWEEISWDEALDEVARRFRKIREDNPRKLLASVGDFQRSYLWAWPLIFGAPHIVSTVGTYCGSAAHPLSGIVDGCFSNVNDYDHCNYWIQIGAGDGFSSHLHLSGSAKRMADARMRGMRLVVVDPRLSVAAAKADEWIPIRPATDRAFVLGLMNVLVFELGIHDARFLKIQTNAPYLVGPDGFMVRDQSGKPLVWDGVERVVKAYDDPTVRDFSLEGTYTAQGVECRPAFQVFKDILKDYTPESMSLVTSVPVETIRRIARELGEAARIGSTIVLDGKEYPYRPAAVTYYRGAHSHADGTLDNMTFKTINTLLGNVDVPGGHLGVPYDFRGYLIEPGPDGMVAPKPHQDMPWMPFRYPPLSSHLAELFPIGFTAGHLSVETLTNPGKYSPAFKPEAMLIYHSNPIWNQPATDKMIGILKSLDFIVAIDILLNESTVWADIVLPDHSYLESYALQCSEPPMVTGQTLRQPVVGPLYKTKDAVDIFYELAERIGFLEDWNDYLNFRLWFYKKPQYMLDPKMKHSPEEILDAVARSVNGDERGLEWFKEHGNAVRKLTPAEMYQPYHELRIPFYFEFIKKTGKELAEKIREKGGEWDTSDYLPLPIWRESKLYREPSEFDMYAICFKEAIHNFADTITIPWLTEISDRDPANLGILINAQTARRKGIASGDEIVVTSPYGEVRGKAVVTQGIHPEVVGVSNGVSRWVNRALPNRPAISFNSLLSPSMDYTDKVTGSFETAARVKVARA